MRIMRTSDWIRAAQRKGWRVDRVSGPSVRLRCAKQGCPGSITVPLENLGPAPDPCSLDHNGQYAAPVFDQYKALVGELVRRRRQIGLSAEDLSQAMGVADGYVNKLEAFHKVASPPTLLLWMQTLGVVISLSPAQMPAATIYAIEGRQGRPYQHAQARFKHDK